jgi:hypothetical protein
MLLYHSSIEVNRFTNRRSRLADKLQLCCYSSEQKNVIHMQGLHIDLM